MGRTATDNKSLRKYICYYYSYESYCYAQQLNHFWHYDGYCLYFMSFGTVYSSEEFYIHRYPSVWVIHLSFYSQDKYLITIYHYKHYTRSLNFIISYLIFPITNYPKIQFKIKEKNIFQKFLLIEQTVCCGHPKNGPYTTTWMNKLCSDA